MIATFTGKLIDPCNVGEADICIEDIAHALALCNRFAGHSRVPYSVAQHSVFVSRLCSNPLQGLLHDASEAYLGDVTRSLKHHPSMAGYREIEARTQGMIYARFECDILMDPSVKRADDILCMVEFGKFVGDASVHTWPVPWGDLSYYERAALAELREAWSWEKAEMAFLARFRALTEGAPE